jgi:hypothetical protein
VRRLAAVAALALLLGGCAWSNRANRPVWNAFEEHLVPHGDAAFYAALPLTVPGGLLAIVTDTFIVHPAQVADDAWDDAAELWDDLPWAGEYYTQLALLPFRALGTPVVLVLSFLGRSCFDLPSREDQAQAQDDELRAREAHERERRDAEDQVLRLLRRMAAGGQLDRLDVVLVRSTPWSDGLRIAFDAALERGFVLDRLELLLWAHDEDLPPVQDDPALGLRDPDPVLRYLVLEAHEHRERVPADVRAALREDPDAAVRALARALWP